MIGGAVLGIDIGSSRVRIATLECSKGKPRLHAVAARDVPVDAATHAEVARPELVAALIEEMLEELDTRERRCVCGIGAPAASLRSMRLPAMTSFERMQTARIEVERQLGRNLDDIVVRIHPARRRRGVYDIGAVARRVLASRVATVRRAGLKVVAVDHEALALRRCFPLVDAIVDVGLERTTFYSFAEEAHWMSWAATGGAAITEAIGRDLHLEGHVAERRKRIVGIAGAGETAVANLVREIGELVEGSKRNRSPIQRLCIVGNGSRIAGLEDRLGERLGVVVHRPVAAIELDERLPGDVARRAMADWALSIGLALWGQA
jgi:Tfp pilus assembly PilM family ATPase